MTHFHELCHGNCVLRYVGAILKLIKLDFRGLKGQVNVKKVNLRGLIANIGHLRPILAIRMHLWPIFMDCAMGIVPYGIFEGF